MERARQRHGSADYRAAEGVMRDVLVRLVNERYEESLAAIACPVELVWGDDDPEVPPAVARALAAALPGATLTFCPGAGHLTPLSVPAELRAAVERVRARS
jgi:pimeloyl-ACP methyl ester carboxylesterase